MTPRIRVPIVDLASHAEPVVTSRQVCAYLQIDHRTFRKIVESGHLKAMKLPGGRGGSTNDRGEWRIKITDLQAFEAGRIFTPERP